MNPITTQQPDRQHPHPTWAYPPRKKSETKKRDRVKVPCMKLVIAEKPAVAREFAKVLGANKRGQGFISGAGLVISWTIGHLVRLAEPGEIEGSWRSWAVGQLPLLPHHWPLHTVDQTRSQFEVLRRLLRRKDLSEVICATDAGREGELIFRYVYELAGCRKPVQRLWISSLTPAAIRRGFENLRPQSEFDALGAAARCRAQADWLVGMNLTRLYTWKLGELYTVGRVQTPTLSILVERTKAIRDFVPEDYKEIEGEFRGPEGCLKATWFDPLRAEEPRSRLAVDDPLVEAIPRRVADKAASIEKLERNRRNYPPPLLYDLTELQRHANRLYGFSASRTLDIAQRLYEERKLISYPRTDSRHLSQDVAAKQGEIVQAIAAHYPGLVAEGSGERGLSRRFVQDAKVSDHHAIIPNPTPAKRESLSRDEWLLYDLIARRLLQAWHQPKVTATTQVVVAVQSQAEGGEEVIDRFRAQGTELVEAGWSVLDVKTRRTQAQAPTLPPGLSPGARLDVAQVQVLDKVTKPPRPHNDASLLGAMEYAGKQVDDEALAAALRERGLGTPATRAAIIDNLIRRGYALRFGKKIEATDKGIALIERVHPHVASPEMTGKWEQRLTRIARGQGEARAFMRDIERFVAELVGEVRQSGGPPEVPKGPGRPPAMRARATHRTSAQAHQHPIDSKTLNQLQAEPHPGHGPPPGYDTASSEFGPGPAQPAAQRTSQSAARTSPGGAPSPTTAGAQPHRTWAEFQAGKNKARPAQGAPLEDYLAVFGLERFRPHQAQVCADVVAGKDVLLVMPTGAGKSLCYQLPGVAMAGTVLVISPLIALMEDQVSKLQAQGLKAERIHSGRSRLESREVCYRYQEGALDYLFIAPERLGVPGFPEFLARTQPKLIAVDEAHCISQWGHDFRPDYRKLRDRLPALRPAPVIALTATATPRVQQDIVQQLGLDQVSLHIHGFRRDNIAIEVHKLKPSQRIPALRRMLAAPQRRPAIVYAPTRKKAEGTAAKLAKDMRAAAYHAGMPPNERERIQAAFQQGSLDVIVATIAFGMGIDKANVRSVAHMAMPSSIEGYYQEIGRAGRDGDPSKAFLLYGWSDRRTHEFFFERSYPSVATLQQLHRAAARPIARETLVAISGLEEEVAANALEKLWIHHGVKIDDNDEVEACPIDWVSPYREQRALKKAQLEEVFHYAGRHRCRMLQLIEYFGDRADSGEKCGHCDICAPNQAAMSVPRRAVNQDEIDAMGRLIDYLMARNHAATGRVFRDLFEASMGRDAFEALVKALSDAGFVDIEHDQFEKDGKVISYRRLVLTPATLDLSLEQLAALEITEEESAKPRRKRRSSKKKSAAIPAANTLGADDMKLFEVLKAWRMEEARRKRCPAFRVVGDATLRLIAVNRPRDPEELLAIKGIGPAKVSRYGKSLLKLLNAY